MKISRRKAKPSSGAEQVGAALRRAGKIARKTARMYGTPIYVWENGTIFHGNKAMAGAVFSNLFTVSTLSFILSTSPG